MTKARPDFGDIRFTKNDGVTELKYWMETSVFGDYAIFWVKIEDDLSSNPATVYIYYGNSNATTTSNIENTFLFGDEDFTNGWAVRYGTPAAWGVSDGVLWAQFSSNDAWIGKAFSYTLGNIKLIFKWKTDSVGPLCHIPAALESGTSPTHPSAVAFRIGTDETPDVWMAQKSNPEEIITIFSENVILNTWYRGIWSFVSSTRTFKLWINDTYKGSAVFSGYPPSSITYIGIGGYSDSFRIDYIAAAKYVDPEPSHGSWGNEEAFEMQNAPIISEFQAPDIVYANRWFLLNATINDPDGLSDLAGAAIEISNDVALEWVALTDTFRKQSDPFGYCTLDSAGSFKTQLNSTAYKLSWKIKLEWSYPEGLVSVVSTNTKVFDNQGASSSAGYQNLFYFEDDLIIYSASVDDSRVNPSQLITFTGTIYYQGTTIPPEDTSRITVRINLGNVERASTTAISPYGTFTAYCASEPTVGSYAYTIFAVTDENSVQNQTIAIIVDRIKVSGYTISDNRANVGDNVNIDVTLVYEYDNTAVTTGTITVNGYAAIHIGSGVYRITRVLSTVGSETYNTVAGSESTYALSTVNQNGQSTIVIWDKVAVTLAISDNRIDVGATADIIKTGFYEYDSTPFTGTITLNDTITKSTVGRYGYRASSISDPVYGLTAFTTNEVYCIFDRININTFTVLDNRINVEDTAIFTVEGVYEYDSTPWQGSYTLNDTATKNAVGKYGYKIANITDSNYALTIFRQMAPDVYVIFDRINVVTYGSDDGRLDVNTEATFYLTLEYEYDNSPVVDGVAYLNGSLPLSWSYANSRWEYKTTKLSVQKLTVYLASINENNHGITALNPNTSSKTISVIWDRIKIADGGATKETLTLGETATIWFKASYEYDETTFNSTNGTLYLNGKPMTWSLINKRWEYTYTANTIGTITFTITAVLDTSQGLTTINDMVGGQTVTVWSMPFAIISNSTITELTFDSTTKIITFKVSGPEGTIGYTNVTIAKTLIQNISELTIYLDGNQINYTFTSTEYTWLIHFTYTHSTHKVTILLTTLNNEPQSEFSLKTIVAFGGILIATIAIIMLTHKKACKKPNPTKASTSPHLETP
jgi:hypothetical protein